MVCHEGAQPSASSLRIHGLGTTVQAEAPNRPLLLPLREVVGSELGIRQPPRGDSTQPLCPKRTSRPSGYDQHYPLPGSSSAPDGEHGEKRRGSSLATGLHGQAESSAQAISRAIANDDHPEAEPGTQELGEVLSYDGVEATV